MRRYTQTREEYLRSIRRLQENLGNMHFSFSKPVIAVEELFKSNNGRTHGTQETGEGTTASAGALSPSIIPGIYTTDTTRHVIERPSIFRKSYKSYIFKY